MECKLFSDNLSRAAGLGNNKDKSVEKMLLDFYLGTKILFCEGQMGDDWDPGCLKMGNHA